MKKRIAFISEHASPLTTIGGIDSGGQNVYVDKLPKELVKLGYEIDIYTRWDDLRFPQIVEYQHGIRVIHIKAGPIQQIPKEQILPFISKFRDNMITFITENDLDYSLIHANFFMSGLVAAQIKERFHIPFVITFHALGKVRREYQKSADRFSDERFSIEKHITQEADQIIAECPQDKEDLLYYYHANQDKISIIPCGFDTNEFYPVDQKLSRMYLGLHPDDFIILQLGRMVPRKGVDNAIEGLAALKKLDPGLPAKLIIVGGDNEIPNPQIHPELQRLQHIAQKAGVEKDVLFMGRKSREQLKHYYNASDVFVSTPWYEPFGITPLEAMACGTPVIGSNVGGIKFSVVDNKTGFLVPPKDPQKLAEKLLEIAQNPSLAEIFRKNAIDRVNNFFTWKTIAHTMSTLYERMIYSQFTIGDEYKNQSQLFEKNLENFIQVLQQSQQILKVPLSNASRVITRTLADNGKILIFGNGGSASDAQHFAGELMGHYLLNDRPALPVLALTADTTVLTAIANDYSYDDLFARQIEGLGSEGDVAIGISTSGNSKNCIKAFEKAHEKGMLTIGLLGKDGGKMLEHCDIAIVVPSESTQHIQETHTHLIHTMCEIVEKQLFVAKPRENTQLQPMYGLKHGRVEKKTSGKKEGAQSKKGLALSEAKGGEKNE